MHTDREKANRQLRWKILREKNVSESHAMIANVIFGCLRHCCLYCCRCRLTASFSSKYYFVQYFTKIYCTRIFQRQQIKCFLLPSITCTKFHFLLASRCRACAKTWNCEHYLVCSSTTTNFNYNWLCLRSCRGGKTALYQVPTKNAKITLPTNELRVNMLTNRTTNTAIRIYHVRHFFFSFGSWTFWLVFGIMWRHMKNDFSCCYCTY